MQITCLTSSCVSLKISFLWSVIAFVAFSCVLLFHVKTFKEFCYEFLKTISSLQICSLKGICQKHSSSVSSLSNNILLSCFPLCPHIYTMTHIHIIFVHTTTYLLRWFPPQADLPYTAGQLTDISALTVGETSLFADHQTVLCSFRKRREISRTLYLSWTTGRPTCRRPTAFAANWWMSRSMEKAEKRVTES